MLVNTTEANQAERYDHLRPVNIQDPFSFFKRLRDEKPVYWSEQYSFWMLTRYQDVKAALQSPSRYSSSNSAVIERGGEKLPPSARESFEIGKRFYQGHIQTLDPPFHTVQRQSLMKGLMPLLAGGLKKSLQHRVDHALDSMERAGICDFVTELAYPLPSTVIFDLLGIPEEHRQTLRETTSLFWTFPNAVHAGDVEGLERVAGQIQKTEAVLMHLLNARRRVPEADLLSALANPESDAMTMSDQDIAVFCVFLLFAGHETTANLLSGGLRCLLEERGQWEKLLVSPDMIPLAVEELLRFVSPVLWMARTVTEDIELDGNVLPKGSDVRLGLGAANRDPNQFIHPEMLDVTRTSTGSLSFGYGLHSCVGAALARMEAQIAFTSLLQRMPKIQLATNQFEYHPVYFLRALKSLPVSVHG